MTEHTLETRQKSLTKDIGHNHSTWGHGIWKGEFVTERERINLDDINPLDYPNIRVQQVATGSQPKNTGYQILETLIIGRHTHSGFKDYFDGANMPL